MVNKLEDTNYLMFMQWAIYNVLGGLVFWVVWQSGWITQMIAGDTTYICRIMIAYFVFAIVDCTWKLSKTSRELNTARGYLHQLRILADVDACVAIERGRSRLAQYLRKVADLTPDNRRSIEFDLYRTMDSKIMGVAQNMSNMVSLGIIGTVMGMMVFSSAFSVLGTSSDPKITELLKAVMPGLEIALAATLLGGAFALWLGFLLRILKSGNVQLTSALIEAGVYRVRV